MSASNVIRPEPITLNIGDINIAGIRHRSGDPNSAVKLFCLHGWLDNANSFVPLMPLLPNLDLVAIDMPGHGYSSHLDSTYTVPDSAYWAAAAIQALGWNQCHIAGHSLGGIIAPLVAAAMPKMVQSLILIESSGALTNEACDFVGRLTQSITEQLDENRYRSKVYENKNDAVATRLRAAKMAPHSAKLIIDRQMSQHDDGWRWRFDPKLRISTAHRLTEAHVREINAAISCPVLSVVASDGFLTSREDTQTRLALLTDHKTVTIMGQHHLHMDTPEPVATAINQFLGTTPDLGG